MSCLQLVTIKQLIDILNNLDLNDIVSFEGSKGTQESIVGPPINTIDLRISYCFKREENEDERK